MRHGQGRQVHTINGDTPSTGGHVRFGFGSGGSEFGWWDPHQGIGTPSTSIKWGRETDCNACGCYGTTYVANPTAGNLWVR